MSINKHAILFDPSETDCDNVGAYLRSSDGTLLTHTTAGSKEALDVNIAASDIQLEVDLDHTEDSVRLGDGTSFFTSTSENGDIALDVHLSNSNIEVTQGTSPWVIGDGGGSITVDFTRLDDSTDTVAIGDGTDTLVIESDGSINVNSSESGFSGCNYESVSVGTTATDLLATELANRKSISIQNLGSKPIFIGCDNSVTDTNGTKIPKGATAEFRMGDSIDVHAITTTGTVDVRILEFS